MNDQFILELLKSSPTLGVMIFAIVWFARRDVKRWVEGVGKYADDYLEVQRQMVDVERDSAKATRDLGASISKSMDRFEQVATRSINKLSSELAIFRQDVAPLLRKMSDQGVKTPVRTGDVLLIASDGSGLLRQSVVEALGSGIDLIWVPDVEQAEPYLNPLIGAPLSAVLIDSALDVEGIEDVAGLWSGPLILIASVDDGLVNEKVKAGVSSVVKVNELESDQLVRDLKGEVRHEERHVNGHG